MRASHSRLARYLVLVPLFGLLLVTGSAVARRGNNFDIYAHLVATRAFWRGESPYTPQVAREVQLGYYGGPLPPGGDEVRPIYPAYTYIILAPTLLLDYRSAIALWLAIQGTATVLALSLWLRRVTFGKLLVLVVVALAYRYCVSTYFVGQFDGLLLLFLSLGVRALETRRDAWAGFFFVLATIHPNLTAPLAVYILLGMALQGRWKGLASFTLMTLALLALTVARVGWYFPDWLANLRAYSGYVQHLAWVPQLVTPLIVVPVAAMLLLALRYKLDVRDLYVVGVVGLLLSLPQTGSYHLVLLLPALVAAHQALANLSRARRLMVLALLVAVFVLSWVYQPLDLQTRKLEALLVPVHVGLVWLAARGSRPGPLTSQTARETPA